MAGVSGVLADDNFAVTSQTINVWQTFVRHEARRLVVRDWAAAVVPMQSLGCNGKHVACQA